MSVYQPKGKDGKPRSQFFFYDFWCKVGGKGESRRFQGPTHQRSRKAALEVENDLRRQAALGLLSSSMTVNEACHRWYDEKGRHCESKNDQLRNLELVVKYFGPDTLLVEITPDMITEAAARRMRQPVERRQKICGELVLCPTDKFPMRATVNRQIIEPLRRLLVRAKKGWGVPIDLDSFDWGAIKYDEDAPRTRELSQEEEARFWQAIRPDYANLCELYLISGRRLSDWIGLSKFKIDRTAGTARFPTRKRKKKGEIMVELTARELEIVIEECDKAPDCEFVFTYVKDKVPDKGKRLPITKQGFRRVTDTAFRNAGLDDFHRHDFRHTFASRAIRAGADLRSLMGAMDHQDISSTVRYAHLIGQQVRDTRAKVAVNRQLPDNVTVLRGKK